MSKYDYSRLNKSNFHNRRKKRRIRAFLLTFVIILILCVIIAGSVFAFKFFSSKKTKNTEEASVKSTTSAEQSSQAREAELEDLLNKADRLALSYDYDKAIELLSTDALKDDPKVAEAIAKYNETKSTLVRQDPEKVPHVFFHSLIVDKSKAFDGDKKQMSYNQVMTTVGEFEKILNILYERGFVLVKIHDVADMVKNESTGEYVMKAQDIMLPPGKTPIVMSQDDVCYYEYMVGDGFASRLVIGEDGRVTTEMDMDDGTSKVGDYDLIPILNKFIDEHPDFSYKGAKAIIALTGYNGIFGYRTAPSYSENPTYEEDKKKATEIANALRADGWEIASHSWGHRHLGKESDEAFKTDCDKWQNEVETLVGETDILIFPFGTDIGSWHPYTDDNARYVYLKNQGFRYFCNVDSSSPYWVQIGKDYMRQGRRNLDGYRMLRDIQEPDNAKLKDLFDANEVYDKDRPTEMGEITS
jgi:putative lipoprotein